MILDSFIGHEEIKSFIVKMCSIFYSDTMRRKFSPLVLGVFIMFSYDDAEWGCTI